MIASTLYSRAAYQSWFTVLLTSQVYIEERVCFTALLLTFCLHAACLTE